MHMCMQCTCSVHRTDAAHQRQLRTGVVVEFARAARPRVPEGVEYARDLARVRVRVRVRARVRVRVGVRVRVRIRIRVRVRVR